MRAGEYRPEIERCADCGVPLVHPEEIATRDARELPRSPGLIAVRTAPIEQARALAAGLDREGIRYYVDRRRAREEGLLTVYVGRQGVVAARAVAEAREQREAPFDTDAWEEERPAARREAPSYKVCPECFGEYRLEIERCADCGIVLVFPEDVPSVRDEEEVGVVGRDVPEQPSPDDLPVVGPLHALPASDDLVCICCRYMQNIPTLSLALDEAGIPHRFERAPFAPPKNRVGCVYVRPADGDAAAAVDAADSESLDDPDLVAELSACPACGTPRSLGSDVCQSCSLELGALDSSPEPVCTRCGAVMGVALPRCPNCGAVLRASA
jgi:ribosomal protein L32